MSKEEYKKRRKQHMKLNPNTIDTNRPIFNLVSVHQDYVNFLRELLKSEKKLPNDENISKELFDQWGKNVANYRGNVKINCQKFLKSLA